MSDTPPPPPPPEGGSGGGTSLDLFPYPLSARYTSMQRLGNLAHGLPAGENETKPDYEVQLEAHKVLLGYQKANADRDANDLKRRAVEVQERDSARKEAELAIKRRAVEIQDEHLAIKQADHQLARERFEDGRKTRKKAKTLPEVSAEAKRRAEVRKRERGGN